MINCKNFKENICAYIDNELSIKERLSFDEHVKNCIECKIELDEMKQIVGLCKDLPQRELPVDFKAELHEKLVAVAQRHESKVIRIKKPKGFLFLKTFASIAAGLLLVLLAGSFYKFGLFSPVKMQDSAKNSALAIEKPVAAEDRAMANVNGSAYKVEIGGITGTQANDFGASGAMQTAGSAAPQNESQAVVPVVPQAAAPTGTSEVDRSAAVQNREAAAGALTAGTEAVNSKLSTITVSAGDPNTLVEKIKALALANNAEIVDNKIEITFSEKTTTAKNTDGDQTVTTADNTGSPVQQQLAFSMPETQYKQFVSALNIEFGAANVQIGAFVTEDMTTSLNSAIVESDEIDNRIQELQKEDSTKNASEIEELKARKEAADKQIDELRLGSDFVNVTVLMNGK